MAGRIMISSLRRTKTFCSKNLWSYVAVAFNRVDQDRLKLVGPDRLCAEWILKNGGAVKFVGMSGKFLRDYNALPSESVRLLLKEIDASDSSIMKIGLEHFKSCKHIDMVKLHHCQNLEGDGLDGLVFIKDTLKALEVSSCYNISDDGLIVIKELKILESLILNDLPYVKDLQKIVSTLKAELPKCKIITEKSGRSEKEKL